MKIVIAECLPKQLIHIFTGYETWTVPQIGLAVAKDSELLGKLDEKGIEVFITIEYQQKFPNRSFVTIIIRYVSNRLESLLLLKCDLLKAIDIITAGNIIHTPIFQIHIK